MTLDYRKIIHFFFPPSADALLIENKNLTSFLDLYAPTCVNNTTTLLPYTYPTVKAAMHLNKYHHHRKAQALLGSILEHHLRTFEQHDTYIVPIPLSRKRLRKRGYNQTEEIVKRATRNFLHFHTASGILKRTRNTKAQTSLSRKERLVNVRGAFSVPSHKKYLVSNAHIILVDDVLTTGATMDAAKAAFKEHAPASVTCIALAH